MGEVIKFSLDDCDEHRDALAKIKVVGVGGGGCNALDGMIAAGVDGVEFLALNTDVQALERCTVSNKIQIGKKVARGWGVGGNPQLGMKSALEDEENIKDALTGANMVFVTCGMGGGTGTGATPVVARVAKELGTLTVGVVTKPFLFEGTRKMCIATDGIGELKKQLDCVIVIPNQKLEGLIGDDALFQDAFNVPDNVLRQAIQGISDIIITPGRMNADFADVIAVMSNSGGRAVMGTATASGNDRAATAVREAMSSPFLEDVDIEGATGVLFNISGGPDLKFHEASTAAQIIHQTVDPSATIIAGFVVDEKFNGSVTVTIIATGFDEHKAIMPEETIPSEMSDQLFSHLKEGPSVIKKAEYITGVQNISPEAEDVLDVPAYLRKSNKGFS